jgi:hypothetical protein
MFNCLGHDLGGEIIKQLSCAMSIRVLTSKINKISEFHLNETTTFIYFHHDKIPSIYIRFLLVDDWFSGTFHDL